MSNELFSINENLYGHVTPAGVYYAVSHREMNVGKQLLINLLQHSSEQYLDINAACKWSGCDETAALTLLYRLQYMEFLFGSTQPQQMIEESPETILPSLLEQLSDTGRALLAEESGLYYAAAGFLHESAEELAALASDVLTLSKRHELLLKKNLGISENAWSICDPTGQSELGFFPLYIGQHTFLLVIGGHPKLQQNEFVSLVKVLIQRYGSM